ncbi:MAG: hypothetical protein ACKOET_16850 [Verrucomicrobiota bacterium]
MVLIGLAGAALGAPRASAEPVIQDFTFALWNTLPYSFSFGNPPLRPPFGRLSHAQLLYAGYREPVPGQPELGYSSGLAGGVGDGRLQPGDLDGERGGSDSATFFLDRPPASLTPPFHVMGLATAPSGGLFIASNDQAPWTGLTFHQVFPDLDLDALLDQVRSDNLQGGEAQSLLLAMIRQGNTVTLPTSLPEAANLDNPSGGPVWGFTDLGEPMDLTYPILQDGQTLLYRANWYLTGPDFVTPEMPAGVAMPLGFAAWLGVRCWRRHARR